MRLSGFLKGDYTTGTRSHLGHRKTATGMKKDEKDDQDSNNLVTILTFNRLLVCSTTSFGFQHQGFGRSVLTNIFQWFSLVCQIPSKSQINPSHAKAPLQVPQRDRLHKKTITSYLISNTQPTGRVLEVTYENWKCWRQKSTTKQNLSQGL